MSTATRVWTADELWELPNHGGRCELLRGELHSMSPSGFDHGRVTMNLSGPLHRHVLHEGLGILVAAETGFLIARDPDTVRAPDIGFVSQRRVPASGRPQKFFSGAPDLAVETTSPFDTVHEIDDKVQEWLAAGTQLVWVVNPRQQTVTAYRPDGTARVLGSGDRLDGGQVVPGFEIVVAEIFR